MPTYTQATITNGFARVFTGWTWHQALQASGQLPTNFYPATDWLNPMTMVKNNHELGTKTLLDNVVLPAAVGYSMTASAVSGSQADTTTAAYDSYCLADLDSALDNIFNHPNVGPYICRQLIQRLVKSNPSPGYLQRVVTVFNDDGTSGHVRGNHDGGRQGHPPRRRGAQLLAGHDLHHRGQAARAAPAHCRSGADVPGHR